VERHRRQSSSTAIACSADAMASHAELSRQERDAQEHQVRTRETRRDQTWIGMESINRIADTAACDARPRMAHPEKGDDPAD